MTGYPWYAGETLTAADLNAAFGAVGWHAGTVTTLGSNLTLTTGTLAATAPVTSVAGRIGAVTLAVADVSGAAPLANPTFTGTVTAATINVGAFTATGITASPISGSTGSFTTLSASSTVSGAGITALLAPYAPLASPALTGTPTAPTATLADNSTKIATTAFVLANSATAVTAAQIAALNFSSLPTSNPGGGKLWLNGGVLQVGA